MELRRFGLGILGSGLRLPHDPQPFHFTGDYRGHGADCNLALARTVNSAFVNFRITSLGHTVAADAAVTF